MCSELLSQLLIFREEPTGSSAFESSDFVLLFVFYMEERAFFVES